MSVIPNLEWQETTVTFYNKGCPVNTPCTDGKTPDICWPLVATRSTAGRPSTEHLSLKSTCCDSCNCCVESCTTSVMNGAEEELMSQLCPDSYPLTGSQKRFQTFQTSLYHSDASTNIPPTN